MARPLQIEIVERARALIADGQHWCRGDLARDINGEEVSPTAPSAVKRCGLGAVIAAAHELTHDLDAARPHWLALTGCSTKLSQRSVDFPATSRRGR